MGQAYRYRTATLLGGWFTSACMARADAIRAGQACRDDSGAIIWRGSARLEAAPVGTAHGDRPEMGITANPAARGAVGSRHSEILPALHPRSITCAGEQESAMGDRMIAIVDDDEAVRASTAFLLEGAGMQVRTFASGEAFLDADLDMFSCVLLDLRMPGADGLAVLEQLADREAMPPTLVITAHGSVAAGVKALKLGAYDFLEKPYAAQDLLSALEVAFDRGRAVRDAREDRERAAGRLRALSQRRLQVVQGVVRGQHNKTIAFELGLSVRTVEAHRAEAMKILGVRTTADLVRLLGTADLPGD